MKWLLTLGLLAICGVSQAQNVTNVRNVLSRATVTMGGGNFNSCGLRFVGLDFDETPRFPAYGFDFNLVVRRGEPKQMFAVLKTEITKSSTLDQLRKASGPLAKVRQTWIQVEGAPAFEPAKTGIPGENGLSSLSLYGDMMGIFKSLMESASGGKQTFLLGVQLSGEPATRVYRFTPEVKKEDGEAYIACAEALVEQWKTDAGK